MKRSISILIVVAMLLATVMGVVPVFAQNTGDDPLATDTVNPEKTEVNKSALDALLKETLNQYDYTAATWQAYADALAAGKTVFENAEADQTAIDSAVTNINTAKTALAERTEILPLKEKISKANALKSTEYLNSTWQVLEAALASANTVLTNYNATEADIADAITIIDNAIKGLTGRKNVMADVNIADQYWGEGNVFYFDYHKFIAAKNYTAGVRFTKSLEETGNEGDINYVMRLGSNVDGSRTTRIGDGIKTYVENETLEHKRNTITINEIEYGHVFGMSFLKAPTVDSVKFYLPTDTKITSIDVYGAVRTVVDSKTLYGKADKGADENTAVAEKVLLGSYTVPAATTGAEYIEFGGALDEAYKVEYIYFALKFASDADSLYYINEIELFGIVDGAENFAELKKVFAEYKLLDKSDYSTDSWKLVEDAIKIADPVNKNCLSTKAQITEATKALSDALAALKVKPAVKTVLEKALTQAKTLLESEYTTATWKTVATEMAKAEAAFASADVAQAEVNRRAAALQNAMKKLVKRGDKTSLKNALSVAKGLKAEYYQGNLTAWNYFQKKISDGEAVYNNIDAIKADIDKATENIIIAQSNLMITPGIKIPGSEPETTETEAPATEPPATEPPATEPPATEPPATEPPATEPPATEPPATEPPATEPPATEPPATEAPETGPTVIAQGGCGSSIAISALAVVAAVGVAVVVKKKED